MSRSRSVIAQVKGWVGIVVFVSVLVFAVTLPFHAWSTEAARAKLESKGYVVQGEVVRRFPFWPCLKGDLATFKATVVTASGGTNRVTVCYNLFWTRIVD